MRRTIDSPWLWLAVFCGFSLLVLYVAQQRMEKRQQQQALLAASHNPDPPSSDQQSNSSNTDSADSPNSFWGLRWILGIGTALGLALMLRSELARRRSAGGAKDTPRDSPGD